MNSMIVDWRPDPGMALRERQALGRAVATSLGRPDLHEALCHPYSFDLASRRPDVDELGDDDLALLLAAIEASRRRAEANSDRLAFAVDLEPLADGGPDLEQRATEMAESATGRTGPVYLASAAAVAGMGETVARAYRLITERWPELAEEMDAVVDVVNVFRSTNATSFTDFRNHGSIFVSADYAGKVGGLAEAMAHEASHVRLNGTMSVAPCVSETDALFSTPLRSDPRPAYGLFHQAYVLRRTVELHARAPEAWPEAHVELTRKQLVEALEEAQDLPLTDVGRQLLEALRHGDHDE
jgi:HEXXH motif-containing protein